MDQSLPDKSPDQIRSARALLGWSQKELARRAQVATSTVADFERGARAPTANNVQSMVKALEDGGVAFISNSVARRSPTAASTSKVAGRTPFRWIEVADIEDWANRRDSQAMLPELICRLIRAECGAEAELRLPSGDAASMKGWDGQCRVNARSNYVPAGVSGWELTVQTDNLKTKADSDFKARTKSPGNLDPLLTTYVFVSAHRWEGKDKWLKERKADAKWLDVRALDAIDLMHWLEAFPSVSSWLAAIIGKRPPNVRELQGLWNEWSYATERPITTRLILSGRDDEATQCIKWLQGPPSALSLQAESAAEAACFVYCAAAQLPPPERDAFLTRSIVVNNADQARKLGDCLTSLYLIVEDADAGLVRKLVGQNHHVCSVFGSEIGVPPDVQQLPRLSRYDAEAALEQAGFKDEAQNVARDIGGSLAVYRRLYPSVPERALPEWAKPENARALLPAFFAGAWDADQQADKEVIQRLSGTSYEAFEKALLPWAELPDSPLRRSGPVWKIASPRDALFRLAPIISSADLKRFAAQAIEIFGMPDPRFSLAPDERWLAPVRGQMPQHSAFLRVGLGETLLVLALFGDKAKIDGGPRIAEQIVHTLLHDADAIRWWSLSRQYRVLAEAAPGQFLAAISSSLARNDPTVMQLFHEDGGLTGGAHHTDLLWALESLAWDPQYLASVAPLLATLARLDPPGQRYANRPLRSLHDIFLWWMPQTTADLADRMDVLDLVRKDEPEIAWKLMLGLLPGNHDSLNPAAKPRWREIPPELPEQSNTHAMLRAAEAITDRLFLEVGEDPSRWASMVKSIPEMPPTCLDRMRGELLARAPSFDRAARATLRHAVRRLLHKHREFSDAQWALPEETLAVLDPVYASLAPTDPIEQIAWLFENEQAELPEKLTGGWEAYTKVSEDRRRLTVEKIWADTGRAGLERLTRAAGKPYLVGIALADVDPKGDQIYDVVKSGLASSEEPTRLFARAYFGRRLDIEKAAGRNEVWAQSLLKQAVAEAWPVQAIADLLDFIPASRALWEQVEQIGQAVAVEYWKRLHPYRVPETDPEVAIALDAFLRHKRPDAAMTLASRASANVPSATIVEILRQTAAWVARQSDHNDLVMFQYYLENLLTALDRRNDVDETTLAQLEWQYFPVLSHSKRPPITLHKALAETPSFFVDVLTIVFRAADDTNTPDETSDEDAPDKARVTQAYDLLRSWHQIPGTQDGVINAEKLEAWVKEARRLANEAGRLGPCDVYIGRVLAYAPAGDDGIWPNAAVRNVIELSRSETIERNLSGGVLEKRGPTWRDPTAGGEQEKGDASRYRAWSQALRFKSPRTSAALENIARMFEGFAKRHDEDVERSSWQ